MFGLTQKAAPLHDATLLSKAMRSSWLCRLLEDAGVAGKGRALSSAMARALACKATGQGRAGFDYKAFLINLARAASHLGVSFDDLVFEMRPLEHR